LWAVAKRKVVTGTFLVTSGVGAFFGVDRVLPARPGFGLPAGLEGFLRLAWVLAGLDMATWDPFFRGIAIGGLREAAAGAGSRPRAGGDGRESLISLFAVDADVAHGHSGDEAE
jgi:hypothetical protein